MNGNDLFSEGYLCRDCYLTVDKYLKLINKLDLQHKELTIMLSASYCGSTNTSQELPATHTRGAKRTATAAGLKNAPCVKVKSIF